jgi:hypothetical protein
MAFLQGSGVRRSLVTGLSSVLGYIFAAAGAAGGLYVRYGLHWGRRPIASAFCYRDNILVLLGLIAFCIAAPLAIPLVANKRIRIFLLIAIPLLAFVIATFVQTYSDWESCYTLW